MGVLLLWPVAALVVGLGAGTLEHDLGGVSCRATDRVERNYDTRPTTPFAPPRKDRIGCIGMMADGSGGYFRTAADRVSWSPTGNPSMKISGRCLSHRYFIVRACKDSARAIAERLVPCPPNPQALDVLGASVGYRVVGNVLSIDLDDDRPHAEYAAPATITAIYQVSPGPIFVEWAATRDAPRHIDAVVCEPWRF